MSRRSGGRLCSFYVHNYYDYPSDKTLLVRLAPSRVDYRDRFLVALEPSHRLSFYHYRRTGLVLPFGASSSRFDIRNPLLYSPDGQWLQNDSVSPLDSWP